MVQVVEQEAAKILQRCDKDGNGVIDEEEFEVYYLKTAEVRRECMHCMCCVVCCVWCVVCGVCVAGATGLACGGGEGGW